MLIVNGFDWRWLRIFGYFWQWAIQDRRLVFGIELATLSQSRALVNTLVAIINGRVHVVGIGAGNIADLLRRLDLMRIHGLNGLSGSGWLLVLLLVLVLVMSWYLRTLLGRLTSHGGHVGDKDRALTNGDQRLVNGMSGAVGGQRSQMSWQLLVKLASLRVWGQVMLLMMNCGRISSVLLLLLLLMVDSMLLLDCCCHCCMRVRMSMRMMTIDCL